MTAIVQSEPYMTEEEYLASEELSAVRREYLGGWVYAMSGASDQHNTIEANLGGLLYNRLRGKPCQHFGSNMKLRVRARSEEPAYHYYPDAMVACDPTDAGHGWRERPAAIFEIISESTRRTDEREKRALYLALPSLEFYVRIEQDRPEVVLEQRTGHGWRTERIVGLQETIRLPSLGIELPLAELYERVTFFPSNVVREEAEN